MADQFNVLDQSWFTSQLLVSGEENLSRLLAASSGVPTSTSGTMRLSYFTARKSEPVTQVTLVSGGTAAGATPTLVRVGLYTAAADGALTLVASTANDTALLAGTFTAYTKALDVTYNKMAGQRYAVGLLVVSGAAMPTLYGTQTLAGSVHALAPALAKSVASLADLPASVATGSLSADNRYMWYALT